MPPKSLPFLTANRIAAIVGVLTGLSAFITGLANVLPGAWQSYALSAVGVIGTIITVFKFLEGSQKWDQLMVSLQRLEKGSSKGIQIGSLSGSSVTGSSSGGFTLSSPPDEKDEFESTPFNLDPPEDRGLRNVPDEHGPEFEEAQTSQSDESSDPPASSTPSTSDPASTPPGGGSPATSEEGEPWWKGKPGIDPGVPAQGAPSGQVPPIPNPERPLTPEEQAQVDAFAESLRQKQQTPPQAGGQ